jgi:hypothetical protein
VKIKPGLVCGGAPVVAFGAGEALHVTALAATMRMAVRMQSMRRAAEAAVRHAAIPDEPPVRAAR